MFIGLRPLRSLARDLERRSPHELTALDLVNLPSEMQPPVAAMNRLMLDLARALEQAAGQVKQRPMILREVGA